MRSLRFALATMFVLAPLAAGAAGADAELAPAEAPRQFFSYPLRAGESLSDVSRIFHVPIRQLVEINHIEDPSRMQLGQTLRIPNAFAQEVEVLRAERDGLLEAKRRAEGESAERQQAAVRLQAELRQVGAEREALDRALAGAVRWQRWTLLLALLLLAALAWALKIRFDRALLAKRWNALALENSALKVAKEKYGQAGAQLELRYQNLHGRRREPPAEAVTEGTARLRRAFDDGAAGIERLLAQLRAEQEKQRALFEAEAKTRSWLFHPLRELLERHRLKYHTP